MNNPNDHGTMTRYCTCYVKKPVNSTIHVCRKCGRHIYRQPIRSWKWVAVLFAIMLACLAILAYGQQNWGARP